MYLLFVLTLLSGFSLHGVSSVTITEFPTKDGCETARDILEKEHGKEIDAYCIEKR